MARALFINEVAPAEGTINAKSGTEVLITIQALRLATPAYVIERDLRELELLELLRSKAVISEQ